MPEATPPLPPDLIVLVPCYNAGELILPVIDTLIEMSAKLIVVDDGSTDGCTRPLMDKPLTLISLPENRGKGHAMMEGFRKALEDPRVACIAVIDADGQHDPLELPRLYQAFRDEKADLLVGSREFKRGKTPRKRRWGNKFTAWLTTALVGQDVPDTQSGYRLHSRHLAEDVLVKVKGGRYDTEMEILVMAARKGYKLTAAPISTIYKDGTSSSHFSKRRDPFKIYWKLLKACLKYR